MKSESRAKHPLPLAPHVQGPNMTRTLVSALLLLLPDPAMYASTGRENQAQELLRKAIDAVGIHRTDGKILHYFMSEVILQSAQSDRSYPPFLGMMRSHETWFNPSEPIQRTSSQTTWFGSGPTAPIVTLVGPHASVMIRDSLVVPLPSATNYLNIWSVLLEWEKSENLRVEKPVRYRDYQRVVLARTTPTGVEKLFVDQKTGFPVKLDRMEPHFLWGQRHVEYLYSGWIQVGNSFMPCSPVRIVDGEPDIYQMVGKWEFVNVEQSPGMTLPEIKNPPLPPRGSVGVLDSPSPDTVGIGSLTYLTRNRSYTEAISFIDGTVYIFDATLGEQRAKQDEEWIEKLFPGKHPLVVVVTDLAWPHIAGVRYWVSRGATIVSHRMSESFLKRVIDRKWTLNPDELEKKRSGVKFKFVPVDKELTLAGGKVKLHAIDGIGSEGALMAYLPDDKFLWAGDYIQTNRQPTAYATEVWRAALRVGIRPERTAAQHLPVTNWSIIDSLSLGN